MLHLEAWLLQSEGLLGVGDIDQAEAILIATEKTMTKDFNWDEHYWYTARLWRLRGICALKKGDDLC